jgi:phospholipid transport system transporter-binding protein
MSKPARNAATSGKARAALRRNLASVLKVVEPAATALPVLPTAENPSNNEIMAKPDAFYLKLDASCTLRETADLQFSLVAASGESLVVDGGGVERVDTAGLQLLVALARRQRNQGSSFEWKAISAELLKCGHRLGLQQELGLPAATGATS